MKTEILNKNNFNYIDKGKGKPIVLLHGLMGSLSNFKNCIEDLPKQGFRVIMPMLPIYDLPLLKTSAKELSNFLNRFTKSLDLDKFYLLGNSLGALVALTCATILENEISGVIASPLPDQVNNNKNQRIIKPIFQKSINNCLKLFFLFFPLEIILFLVNKLGIIKFGLNSAYFKKNNIDKELIDMVTKPVLRKTSARSLRAMCIGMSTRQEKLKASYLLNELSKRKKVPFLMIWGNKDKFIPLFLGKKIANLHRWVILKIVSNSGHCVHDEDPSLFNKISYEWIRDLKTL